MRSDEITARRGRVEALLTAAVRAGMFPGAVAAWSVGDGAPASVSVGSDAVVGPRRPVDTSTWYDLASLTKPLVTGTLALLASDEGRLELDATLREVLPETRGSLVGERSITHLLTHTSGLPAWAPVYALTGGRRDRLVDVLGQVPLQSRAGERVCYSCLGFLLLGASLERIFGLPLDRVFNERVLVPLGLLDAAGFLPDGDRVHLAAGALTSRVEESLTREAGFDPALVPGRRQGDPDDGNARFLGGVAGNAGLFGTALAVLRLTRLHLDGDGLLDARVAAAGRLNLTPGLEQSRGLAWQLAASTGCSAGPWLSPRSFGHTGFTGTSTWLDPSRSLAVVLLSNRLHPGGRQPDLHPLRRALHRILAADVAAR